MTPLDIIITILSLVYIFLAIRNNPMCFVVAIFQCGLWTYHDFVNLNLIFDGILQIFYIIMAIWGLITWRKSKGKDPLKITSLSWQINVATIISGILISIFVAYLSGSFFSTQLPYLDATTTGFAIVATYLLIYRKIDNWIYFIIIDLTYVYIYIKADSLLLAGIMVVYSIMAVIGYYNWRKIWSGYQL